MLEDVHIIGPPDPSADVYARLLTLLRSQGELLRVECDPDHAIRDSIVTFGAVRLASGSVLWWLLHNWPDAASWLLTVNTSQEAVVKEDMLQVGLHVTRLLNALPPSADRSEPSPALES